MQPQWLLQPVRIAITAGGLEEARPHSNCCVCTLLWFFLFFVALMAAAAIAIFLLACNSIANIAKISSKTKQRETQRFENQAAKRQEKWAENGFY